MDEIFKRIKQVSESGDIDAFYILIREDVNLLDHIDKIPFVHTPLHIAAFAGHIQFSLEMMGLKPSFARKPNLDGFSPIHLALQNGHIELVRRLIQADGDLVRVKGRERLTSLHYVVAKGDHLDLFNHNATSYEAKLSKKEDPQHFHQIKTKPTLQTMEKS